jgi:hypothetical protein
MILLVSALIAAPALTAGDHWLTLHWIDGQGICRVASEDGKLVVHGQHKGKDGDFVELDGVVDSATETTFTLTGKIVTRVSHIFGGKACPREGTFTFRATGSRRYWRLKEKDNPCDVAADYVDIYFDGPATAR